MTKDEAINVLKNTTLILGRVNGKIALAEAVNMAITALQTDGDCISRQAAIDAPEAQERQRATQKRRYTFGNDEFSLEAAYHDCKLVFDGITDDDSFQEADTGLILYYANEIIYALHEALEGKDIDAPSNNILRHPSCKNRTFLGNCDPVGGFCSSVPKDVCAKYYVPDTNVGDTIYRQDAIELAMQYCPDDDGTCSKADEDIRNLLDELEALPPAHPGSKELSLTQKTLDTISRQAAIETVNSHRYVYENKHLNDYEQGWNDACDYCADEWLDDLPSVQTETHDKRTETHACDCISRQAAIDIFDDYNVSVENGELEAYRLDRKRLCDLPSVQPERFKGCKNCIHLGHGYMMPCKNCRRNQVMPDWYEVET